MVKEELIDWKLYACGANGQIYSYYYKRYLKGAIAKDGYVQVCLKCIDGKYRLFQWHRVIWAFFYGTIPEGMQCNHISEVKTDNRLSNLNLMTQKENINWGTGIERSAIKRSAILSGRKFSEEHKRKISESLINNIKLSKPVVAIDSEGNVVYEFVSISEAGRNGFSFGNVSACCNKYYGKLGNFYKDCYWYFKEDYLNEKESERC